MVWLGRQSAGRDAYARYSNLCQFSYQIMIIFLYGPDSYRSRQKLYFYQEGFKKKYDPQGLNIVRLDGERLTLEDFRKNAGQTGFLASKRFIVVENVISRSKNKKIEGEIVEYLKAQKANDNVFIFLEEGESKSKKKTKKVSTRASTHPLLDYLMEQKAEEFPYLYGEELNKWIKAEIKKSGGLIDNAAVLELASLVGSDLWNMSSEIEKLSNYKNKKNITADDVRLLVRAKFDENIFHLTDALAAKDAKLSFKLLNDQIALGAHELYLLTMLTRQFRILLQTREILESESNYYTIASRLKLHPFVAQKAIRDARRFTLAELKNIYHQLLEIDVKIKSSSDDPRLLFDLLIISVCGAGRR
jgi:DNA polymerase III subunit delta